MLQTLKEYIFGIPKTPTFKPRTQTVLQDTELTKQVNEEGYCVVDFLSKNEKDSLLAVIDKFHTTNDNGSGAFLGVISKNIHDAINEILINTLHKWFYDFNTVNAFLVKTPGKHGQVPIHQDVAAIDEEKFSTVNVWIPLQDITAENGVMYVVPKSHHIFSPYRGANIDALTKNIEKEIRPFFKPIYLKVGQALFFDSRMFHFSPPNQSDKKRVITVCRIFPKAAKMISYFKEKGSVDNKIEMWQCQDDYLIYKNGYDDNERPPHAKLLCCKQVESIPISAADFEKRRVALGIEPQENAMSVEEYMEALDKPFAVGFERP